MIAKIKTLLSNKRQAAKVIAGIEIKEMPANHWWS